MASSSRLITKLLIAALIVGAGIFFAVRALRPTAQVAKVVRGNAVNAVPGSIGVAAEFTMELRSEIGGRIVRSELNPGARVKQGAILVQIDTGDLKLEIEQTESAYTAAKDRIAVGSQVELELETAQADLDNAERLAKLGSLSDSELQKQRRTVKQIAQKLQLEVVANRQLIEGYENTLKVKKRQLEKMTITAPFDGVVSVVYARVGDLIGSSASIASLIATSRTVEARISEENFSGVQIGQKAVVRFLGYGAQQYDASVIKILPTADPLTQRYIVHLDVNIKPELLVPGITGEVSIIIGERQNALILPRRALVGSNVFVVEGGRVTLREVKQGYTSLNAVEITSGVAEGDFVIVENLDQFRDGDQVRTVTDGE